jgi:hypothetical protein
VARVSGNESHCKNKSLTILEMGIDVFAVVIELLIFVFLPIRLVFLSQIYGRHFI